ncbi:predicted protein [Postia placenta Mad-698-R]|nr:predicted protein [Postia placenta Mad-698-R]
MGSDTLSVQNLNEYLLLTVNNDIRKAKAELASPNQPLTIHAADKLSRLTTEYRPSFYLYDATLLTATKQLVRVVLKISGGDEGRNNMLTREAWAYQKLKNIQGRHVPTCFGLYGRGSDYCLVLEHCGRDIRSLKYDQDPLRGIPWDTKRAIMQSLQAIHREGVLHRNLMPMDPNIVIDEASSSVRFVGFGLACEEECLYDGDIGQEFDQLAKTSIGCDELHRIGKWMLIWLPGSRIASQVVKDEDVEQILKDYPALETLTEDKAREDIRRAIEEYKIQMECRKSGKYQPCAVEDEAGIVIRRPFTTLFSIFLEKREKSTSGDDTPDPMTLPRLAKTETIVAR